MQLNFDVISLVNEIIRLRKAMNDSDDDRGQFEDALDHLVHFLVYFGKKAQVFEIIPLLDEIYCAEGALRSLIEALSEKGEIEDARKAADLLSSTREENCGSESVQGYILIARSTEEKRDCDYAREKIRIIGDPIERAIGLLNTFQLDPCAEDIDAIRKILCGIGVERSFQALDLACKVVRLTRDTQDFILACELAQKFLNATQQGEINLPKKLVPGLNDNAFDRIVRLFQECKSRTQAETVARHITYPLLAQAIATIIQAKNRSSKKSPNGN
jgi:hypothetical protein